MYFLRKRLIVALSLVLLVVATAQADKKPDWDSQPVIPTPDALLVVPGADTPLPYLAEPTLRQKPKKRLTSSICGIDVSHYQGAINWQMVSTDENVRYVYIKATESSGMVDSHFQHNLIQARKYGIPAGVYHFFSPSTSESMQFANFHQNVSGMPMDLIPIVDVEHRGRAPLATFQNRLRNFLLAVERMYGVKPIIYTGINFYNKYLAGKFTNYPFMIARYGEEWPELADDLRILMWQFTDKGSISGIHGNVDRSCFMKGYGLKDITLPQKKEF